VAVEASSENENDEEDDLILPLQVDAAFRILLGRPPESEHVIADWCKACDSVEQLAEMLRDCDEFRALQNTGASLTNTSEGGYEPRDLEIFARFARYQGPGKLGFVTDFLGTRTSTDFIASIRSMDGAVEGLPIPTNFHAETVEWIGALKAVISARQRFVAVELGAGWGPWLVTSARAAESCGIDDVHLVGVEGDATHFQFMREHFVENGLDPGEHTLLLGVAAEEDGTASFPVIEDPTADWGAAALTETMVKKGALMDYRGLKVDGVVSVPAYSLPSLLEPFDEIDLVHCDIQGAEERVLSAAIDALNAKVRWLVVGTHSRLIEGQLIEMFMGSGWDLEQEKPCLFQQSGAIAQLTMDGCQVWRNHRSADNVETMVRKSRP